MSRGNSAFQEAVWRMILGSLVDLVGEEVALVMDEPGNEEKGKSSLLNSWDGGPLRARLSLVEGSPGKCALGLEAVSGLSFPDRTGDPGLQAKQPPHLAGLLSQGSTRALSE